MILFLLACVPPTPIIVAPIQSVSEDGLAAELVVSGPLSERVRSDDADLVIFYGSEERGSLEACGCPNRPRGGLARQASYIVASRAANPSAGHLIVNGGGWLDDAVGLDGRPRPETPVQNGWMSDGLAALGVDALNIGYPELAGLRGQGSPPSLPLVSANLSGDGVEPWVVISAGGLRVGVTGISTTGSRVLETPGFARADPVRAGRAALVALAERSDVQVLLAYQAPEAAGRLAREGLADVVVDVQQHRERYAPIRVGGAIWVRSHYQTQRLGELRLQVEGGEITDVLDRKIDMDPSVPSDPRVDAVVVAARRALELVERGLYGG